MLRDVYPRAASTRRLDRIRLGHGETANHLVDEFVAGRIDRREFLRRGAVVGLSAGALSMLAGCQGSSDSSPPPDSTATGGEHGGTLRLSVIAPAAGIDPLLATDPGSVALLALTGEFLCVDRDRRLTPWLAESWTPNGDASVWTFTIRKGVRFNDGAQMTARDVAATFERLVDPAHATHGLSMLAGVLSRGGAKAIGDDTVVFTLDAPNGSFPHYVCSANPNAVILPAGYSGGFDQTWPGTGPWKNASFGVGSAAFVRNGAYWGRAALPDRLDVTFAPNQAAQVLALEQGQVDIVQQVTVAGAQTVVNDPRFTIVSVQTSSHPELSMRCDLPPFGDRRVRQALALALDRPATVQALFQGNADVGNDSPFAPAFAQTDSSVAQRAQNLDLARRLLLDAGLPSGFSAALTAFNGPGMPECAQIVVAAAADIGIDITVSVERAATSAGGGAVMELRDRAHLGVPNAFLCSPLLSGGGQNVAHFADPVYDALVDRYVAAIDLHSQRVYAGQIETLLLDETPIIYPYFPYYLAATRTGLSGLQVSASGQIWADQVSVD
jgi:peptide/nickel transport system substrate-binding protein